MGNELEYRREFNKLEPQNGKVSLAKALATVRLPSDMTQHICRLVSVDKDTQDTQLSLAEFALVMHFTAMVHEGHKLPEILPESMRSGDLRPRYPGVPLRAQASCWNGLASCCSK